MKRFTIFLGCIIILSVIACKTPGKGIFSKKTPHEQYSKSITDAGLQATALGRSWFNAAENGLQKPLTVAVPYKESGYFAAERPDAVGLKISARRGEKLRISLEKKPATGFRIYMDLWQRDGADSTRLRLVGAADTSSNSMEHEAEKTGMYVVRIQPELLQSGEYTLSISTGPSLAYPLKASGKNHIQSFWGDTRDAGARRHEGIDMFAPKRTPAIAAANGVVTRVNENRLGGKVVWMRPDEKPYTLYYAHLDTQLVNNGDRVRTGDTLGLVGNTGNAQNTPPHLHFGIYGLGGALDPFPFVNPLTKTPGDIDEGLDRIGKQMRIAPKTAAVYSEPEARSAPLNKVEKNTLLRIDAVTSGWYKVSFPDGTRGFVNSKAVDRLSGLRAISLKSEALLLDAPDSLAAIKVQLGKNADLQHLASFKEFQYVRTEGNVEGWIREQE
jgi:murein DD-endopeptidase MepM/ murein hydrolase activator NlpD